MDLELKKKIILCVKTFTGEVGGCHVLEKKAGKLFFREEAIGSISFRLHGSIFHRKVITGCITRTSFAYKSLRPLIAFR
jgi:hypothetical protein